MIKYIVAAAVALVPSVAVAQDSIDDCIQMYPVDKSASIEPFYQCMDVVEAKQPRPVQIAHAMETYLGMASEMAADLESAYVSVGLASSCKDGRTAALMEVVTIYKQVQAEEKHFEEKFPELLAISDYRTAKGMMRRSFVLTHRDIKKTCTRKTKPIVGPKVRTA